MNTQTTLRRAILAVLVLAAAILAACGATPPPAEPRATLISEPLPTTVPATPAPRAPVAEPTQAPEPTQSPTAPVSPLDAVNLLAREAVLALRDQDMEAVAALVHPDLGLLFSPEAYVDDGDRRFSPSQVAALMTDPVRYSWGHEAGSGFPIERTFTDYYHEYVYDRDYAAAPQVGFGERIGGAGGTIDNTGEFWPGSVAVEYHFPGSAQYEGMDWTSLRLVFQHVDDAWYLVAIIHDEWSP